LPVMPYYMTLDTSIESPYIFYLLNIPLQYFNNTAYTLSRLFRKYS